MIKILKRIWNPRWLLHWLTFHLSWATRQCLVFPHTPSSKPRLRTPPTMPCWLDHPTYSSTITSLLRYNWVMMDDIPGSVILIILPFDSLSFQMFHLMRISLRPWVWTRVSASHVNPLPQCTTLAVGYWEEPRPTSSHTLMPSRWRTLELMRSISRCWNSYH